jgi:hypothetical protein
MKNAKHLFITIMGALMGAAGMEHGVGELIQGNVAAQGIMIRSWPESPFFQSLSGEPALTLIPNLQVTGVLAISFSLLFTVCAIFFSARKSGGVVMMMLAVPMLLFGSGIFPPILGALIGAGATVCQNKLDPQLTTGLRWWFGKSWRWIFAACCIAWLALFPGVAILGYFFGIDDTNVTVAIILIAFTLLILTFWSSVQHDRISSHSPNENTLVKFQVHSDKWKTIRSKNK